MTDRIYRPLGEHSLSIKAAATRPKSRNSRLANLKEPDVSTDLLFSLPQATGTRPQPEPHGRTFPHLVQEKKTVIIEQMAFQLMWVRVG